MNHFFYLFTIHHWADGGSNDIVHQRKAKTTHQTNKKTLCDVIQVFGRQGTVIFLKVAMFTLCFSPVVTPLVGSYVADAGLTFENWTSRVKTAPGFDEKAKMVVCLGKCHQMPPTTPGGLMRLISDPDRACCHLLWHAIGSRGVTAATERASQA